MADSFQIPQRNPQYVAPVAPPTDLINAYLNRQQQASNSLAGTVPSALNDYLKYKVQQQQLKASAFGEGGPYLYNLLYGKGQQASTTPPNQVAGQQPQAPQTPTSAPDMSQGEVAGQVPPDQSQQSQPGQPAVDPMSPGGTIHTSLSMGHPDFAGYGQKIADLTGQMTQSAGMYGPSKFGQANQQMLGGQLNALKTGMEAQTAPLNYAKTAGEVDLQPTEKALKEQQLENAKAQVPQEIGKGSAEQQNKYQTPEIKIQAATLKLQRLQDAYNKVPANLKGAYAGTITSKAGSPAGKLAPDLVAYNKLREAAAVSLAIARNPENPRPSPQDIEDELKNLPSVGDDPRVAANLFGSTVDDLKDMHTLNTKGAQSAAGAFGGRITPGAIPKLNTGKQSQGPHGNTVVQNGHTYTWNGTNYE